MHVSIKDVRGRQTIEECYDVPGWVSAVGKDCNFYEQRPFNCGVPFADPISGWSSLDACCVCGGGLMAESMPSMSPFPSAMPSTTPSATPSTTPSLAPTTPSSTETLQDTHLIN